VSKRLERACTLFEAHPESMLLLSGKGHDEPVITEASAMCSELVGYGIPVEKILLEELSTDTLQNAYFSREILDQRLFRGFVVVTNEFHMQRTQGIFDWVFGADYNIHYSAVSNAGIDKETLEKRMLLEKALDQFYRTTLYPAALPGSLSEVHDVLFNPENSAAKAHADFLKSLTLEHTLY